MTPQEMSLKHAEILLTQISFEDGGIYTNGPILVVGADVSYVKKVKRPDGETCSEITFRHGEKVYIKQIPENWVKCVVTNLGHLSNMRGDKAIQKNVIRMQERKPKETSEFDGPDFHTSVGEIC